MQTITKPVLALDVGKRRIGVAVVRPDVLLARPLPALQASDAVVSHIQALVHEHGAATLVIGLPRGLDGQDTQQTQAVRDFAASLTQVGAALCFQDEAVTSVKAREMLQASRKPYTKEDIDSQAAVYILEDYIRDNRKEQLG